MDYTCLNHNLNLTKKELIRYWDAVLRTKGLSVIGSKLKRASTKKDATIDDYRSCADSNWDREWNDFELEQLAKELENGETV